MNLAVFAGRFGVPASASISSRARGLLLAASSLAGAMLWTPAYAGNVITVGRSGLGNNCTVPSIQAAIDRADDLGGFNIIWVSRDVPDQVWREHLVIENQDLDIIGGFDDCNDVEPSGRTDIMSRAGDDRPVIRIRGSGVVNLRGLTISEGRTGGIEYVGRGALNLENTSVERNGTANGPFPGIYFAESGGDAYLQFLDDVSVSDNRAIGVSVWAGATLTMGARRNSIARNGEHGLLVTRPAFANVSATGNVFTENLGFGVLVSNLGGSSSGELFSRLFSSDPADPLQITRNGRGAVLVRDVADPHRYTLCMKDVRITHHNLLPTDDPHGGALIRVHGSSSRLNMNGECSYPPDAATHCTERFCNLIAYNTTFIDRPLISVTGGAVALVDRMSIESNTGGAAVSANFDSDGDTSVVVSNTLVIDNQLERAVFESMNGASVTVRNATAAANLGLFGFSLLSDGAEAFSVTDSILDDDANLLALGENPDSTEVIRVMARNAQGTRPEDVVILGPPDFIPGTYRLTAGARGVDYSFAIGGHDLAGDPRDVDTQGVDNLSGPRDLGAYESQVPVFEGDRIFADGFD